MIPSSMGASTPGVLVNTQLMTQQLPAVSNANAAVAAAAAASAGGIIPAGKVIGGVTKKIIDKQSRKERNRNTLLKQTSVTNTLGNYLIISWKRKIPYVFFISAC